MRKKYFKQQTSHTDENEFGLGLIIFVVGVIALVGLFFAVKLSFSYAQQVNYYEQADTAQGVLIERIRIPRHRNAPLFYLRYKYENETAKASCSVDFETGLTPKDRACRVNVDRIKVSETAYRAAKVPSELTVYYMPNQDFSWSQIEGHTAQHTRSLAGAIMCLILSLGLGVFTVKALRTL